jgi:hypothetical protein
VTEEQAPNQDTEPPMPVEQAELAALRREIQKAENMVDDESLSAPLDDDDRKIFPDREPPWHDDDLSSAP